METHSIKQIVSFLPEFWTNAVSFWLLLTVLVLTPMKGLMTAT
jgi:hypothetical protein